MDDAGAAVWLQEAGARSTRSCIRNKGMGFRNKISACSVNCFNVEKSAMFVVFDMSGEQPKLFGQRRGP